jgi:hypothetical protein
MRRRRLVLLVTIAVAATAGCIGPFGESAIPEERLGESANYEWDVDANATYTITTNGTYQAVYRLQPADVEQADDDTTEGSRTLELYRRDGLGQRRPIANISAVHYRYPNETVLTGTPIEAQNGPQVTTLTLPASDGLVAYTAQSPPKRFETVVFVDGSHDVILPPDRRVGNPIFGHVSPPTDNRTWTTDGRRVLRWDAVGPDRISVRYYRPRDVTLFAGLVGLFLLLGALGAVYVYRQIRQLRAEREELDVDVDLDDSGRDPPPGLR